VCKVLITPTLLAVEFMWLRRRPNRVALLATGALLAGISIATLLDKQVGRVGDGWLGWDSESGGVCPVLCCWLRIPTFVLLPALLLPRSHQTLWVLQWDWPPPLCALFTRSWRARSSKTWGWMRIR